MYSVESPFNEEDLLNTLLEALRIQEGPSKQMMESFEKAVFQEIEKENKKKSPQVTFLQTMPFLKQCCLNTQKVFLFRSIWTSLFQIRIICNLCEVVYF